MPFDYEDDNLNTGLYEFPTFFSGNTGDLTATSTGSGVHLFKDIRIQLDVLDRDENSYNDEGSFLSSAFTSKFQIDIIDISGNDIKTGYLTDYKNPFFTFNEVENIDVFGDYAKHFGVRTKLIAQDDLESQSEFYFYGNIPAISGVAVKDGTGTTFHTGSSSDKSGVNSTGQTGQVSLTVTFDNDMSYVKMKELDVFITTGSGFDIEDVDATLFPSYTQPINQLGIQTFPIDETKFDTNSGDYYFHLVPHSAIGSGVAWTVGPNRIVKQPIDRSPFATTDEAVLIYGEQTASGNKFFKGETMTFGGADHDVVPLTTGNTIAGGRANSISGDTPAFNFIGGGSGNIVFDSDYSVVVGGEEDDISGGAYNFIGGGKDVDITGSSFSSSIGGFNNDILDANSSIIAGGQNNLITGTGSVSSFLGGGQNNTVERSAYSVVVGGTGNYITGDDSEINVIGGGSSNTIAGSSTSTIAGGGNNTITGIVGGASFIGGGTNNNINNATSAVIAGGISNEIKSGSRFSLIGGGLNNEISGEYSSILGGEDHILRGDDSAILAGTDHQIYATGSFIAGAKDSITSGENSYILGRKGSIPESHSGAAVFADGQDRIHSSSGEHTAVLDFASGVYIESQSGLYVSSDLKYSGTLHNGPREEYVNSNIIRVNQRYTGGSIGSYFEDGEYQKVVTITPDGDAQNYQIVGKFYVQSGAETQTIEFDVTLRSETLPDLGWEIYYNERHTGTRYIKPVLWTKETSTAAWIIAFEVLTGSIYGSVTADIDIIPRSSSQKDNVVVNTTTDSEQASVESGFTQREYEFRSRWIDEDLSIGGDLTVDTDTLFVDASNDRVGIGATAPESLLHLASAGPAALTIEADTDNVNESDNARIVMKQDGGTVVGRIGYEAGENSLEFINEYNDSLSLGTNNSRRLIINGSGNVGIATTAPTEKLEVNGKILADNLFTPQWVTPITLGACPTYTAGSGTVTNEGRGVGLSSGATASDEAAVKLERYFACGRGSGQSTRLDYWNTIVGVSFTRVLPNDMEFFIEIGTNGLNSPVGPPSDTDEGIFFTLKRVSGSYTFDIRHNRGSAATNTTSLGNSTTMNANWQFAVEIRTLKDGTLQLYTNNNGNVPTLHTEWTGLTFGQNGGSNDNNVWVGYRSIGRSSGNFGVGATKAYLGYWR